jgi:hypothetical protein
MNLYRKYLRNPVVSFLFISIFISISGVRFAVAQQQMTVEQYIDRYKDIAMDEMRRHGIPASIKLAQGILESGFGNSDLAVIGKNHFGIKCHGWRGRTFYKDDDHKDECFRAYDDPLQSFRDHSEFLRTRAHYAPLFELDVMDYKAWARGLRQSGYATNPRYPELLIGIIERNQLHQYDRLAFETLAVSGSQRHEARPAGRLSSPNDNRANEEFVTVSIGREEHLNNRIRYVYARPGDTPERIAGEMGIWPWEIYRYNEMEKNRNLSPGQIVYLQPKRRQGSESYHIVKEGETMYEISQMYGVRLSQLYKRNAMEEGIEPKRGQKVILRGRIRR